ncbi:MAG: hypothetical protein F6K17_27460, partial [Okeania sp. SIO3C4]|nr:hypothetical protein [Okeania sp. SIO3C4]
MPNSILCGFMVNSYSVYLKLYIPEQFMKGTDKNTNTEPDQVGTTEAAFLLNISTARLRLLLRQGRLK